MRSFDFTNSDNSNKTLHRGNFWEHWFDTQSPIDPVQNRSDEHRVWEQAIHIGILAAQQEEF